MMFRVRTDRMSAVNGSLIVATKVEGETGGQVHNLLRLQGDVAH